MSKPSNPPINADFDLNRATVAIRELLVAIGEDPDREGLRDTPRRVAKMYQEFLAGLREDPNKHLSRTFAEEYDEIVILRGISFASLCEHHLLPFIGQAHVAYLPNKCVVGLSKLARTVHTFARRPQLQERLTTQVADAIMEHLDARGVLVVIESEHMCMKVRGVNEPNSMMVTSVVRGVLRDNAAARQEAMALIDRR